MRSLSPPSYPIGIVSQQSIVWVYSERKTKRVKIIFCTSPFPTLPLHVFFLSLFFFYPFYVLFFCFLAFLCFILLYFLLTNDLRGAAPEPIIPNIPLTRSVNVGLIASRSLVSWWRRWSIWLLTKMEVLRYCLMYFESTIGFRVNPSVRSDSGSIMVSMIYNNGYHSRQVIHTSYLSILAHRHII